MKKILWLASYPKSGNTWFRVFLENLLNSRQGPANINELSLSTIASSRDLFDLVTGIESSDLSWDEIERLRPSVYQILSNESASIRFLKVHDACHPTSEGTPLIPYEATFGALYFIRNPLDVTVSFAHHEGSGMDRMVGKMGDPETAFATPSESLHNQLPQRLQTWSQHVLSWVDAPFPVHCIRYEDMKQHTFQTFQNAVRFCGLSDEENEIRCALSHSELKALQSQEEKAGFREKNPKTSRFFRRGISGSWRDELSPEQSECIIADHEEVMKRFGYLDDHNLPVY